MFITKFSVSVTFAVLSLLTSMGASPIIDGPSINARSAGISQRMQEAIQMIQKDMWKIDNKLTIIEKYALPNLSYSKSSNLNEEIENTIQHSNHADGRCQRIVDTFPNSAAAADAMRTILQYGQAFGTALAQSKRPVGGDATDLPANLNTVRGYLRTINAARNTLIGVAQSGDATSFWT
ncbi:hypothetical protein Pst134EA_017276 [Puccinia striiformis f. sp. tritici]|uniref:Secreted protein n=1 Tax=Puccinia striiformis f. sp. tritici PST-78 TaxID=1165861 RepID=A0A0L0VNW4_9BASI|nr:hypothetical protein Pst134EA_017276 [Puccinia striiformis f. sp. tritici]KAH9450668.1 hypothetical protein Pst134EB_018194 [Puccinia striiformis f. sp. tritici]KAH9460968.1 hypothetical protein Pst134EA_017276 [Puccinia striiformis f. sp. tritici]KNF00720.1 hypothetical protein PSTG_06134 [Puccinia striiformis f. sp. tritici PST-78]